MSTANYTDTQAAFGFFGYFDFTTSSGKRNWFNSPIAGIGAISTWTGYMTGTSATMACTAGSTAPYSVSVDGGAETVPTLSGGVIQLFTGLTDAAHIVRIRSNSSYNGNNHTPSTGTLFAVTGASPAIGQGSDMGTSWMFNDPSAPLIHSFFQNVASPPAANIVPTFDYLYYGAATYGYADGGCVMFSAQCSSIWIYGGSQDYWYSIDGGAWTQLLIAQASSTTSQWRKVLTGLDSTAMHRYLIKPSYRSGVDVAATGASWGVMLGGTSATFGTKPSVPRIMQFGDSITYGGSTMPDTGSADVYQYANSMNMMPHQAGIPGINTATLLAAIPTWTGQTVGSPKYAVLAIGRNDAGSAKAGVITSYTGCVNALLTAGFTKIMCRKIVPDQALAFDTNATDFSDADIKNIVTGFANPNISYMGDDTWLGITTVEGSAATLTTAAACVISSVSTNVTSLGLFFAPNVLNVAGVVVGQPVAGVGIQAGTTVATITPTTVNATALVASSWYQIKVVGTTDFTLVGAASNTVGLIFQATGVGTGTGTATYTGSITLSLMPTATSSTTALTFAAVASVTGTHPSSVSNMFGAGETAGFATLAALELSALKAFFMTIGRAAKIALLLKR